MKKKLSVLLIAVVAVICAAVFVGCGASSDPATLYEKIFEVAEKYEGTTTMTEHKIAEFDGADSVSTHGYALLATDTESGVTTYKLWAPGKGVFYEGEYYPSFVASWLWYTFRFDESNEPAYTVFTTDGRLAEYTGNVRPVSSSSDTVTLGDGRIVRYDRETDTVSFVEDEKPVLDAEQDRVAVGDVFIETISDEVFKIYDKDGAYLRMVNLANIVPGETVTPVLITEKGVFLRSGKTLVSDAKDYDYSIGTTKYSLDYYFYDWKSGKVSDKDLGFVVTSSLTTTFGAGIAPIEVRTIYDNKTLSDTYVQIFDADFNVVIDLQAIFPGANEIDQIGDYLYLSDGAIARLYDAEGNIVTEYAEGTRTIDDSGLFKSGNDYFALNGSYLFSIDEGKTLVMSVPGRVYYTEQRVDASNEPVYDESGLNILYDFKVFDVATGQTSTICGGEYFETALNMSQTYVVSDENNRVSVYRFDNGEKVAEFDTANVDDVSVTYSGSDYLYKYTVEIQDGASVSFENRYVYLEIETVYPDFF